MGFGPMNLHSLHITVVQPLSPFFFFVVRDSTTPDPKIGNFSGVAVVELLVVVVRALLASEAMKASSPFTSTKSEKVQ